MKAEENAVVIGVRVYLGCATWLDASMLTWFRVLGLGVGAELRLRRGLMKTIRRVLTTVMEDLRQQAALKWRCPAKA